MFKMKRFQDVASRIDAGSNDSRMDISSPTVNKPELKLRTRNLSKKYNSMQLDEEESFAQERI